MPTTWEYRIEHFNFGTGNGIDFLNRLAKMGWQVVAQLPSGHGVRVRLLLGRDAVYDWDEDR